MLTNTSTPTAVIVMSRRLDRALTDASALAEQCDMDASDFLCALLENISRLTDAPDLKRDCAALLACRYKYERPVVVARVVNAWQVARGLVDPQAGDVDVNLPAVVIAEG